MSRTVESLRGGATLSIATDFLGILKARDDTVMVTATNAACIPVMVPVKRVDLLTAIADECGVIVVDRGEWPMVRVDGLSTRAGSEVLRTGDTVASLRTQALSLLALAEHLDAHPPVDEQQVEALGDLIRDALGVTPETVAAGHLRQGDSGTLARRLVARGVRVGEHQ